MISKYNHKALTWIDLIDPSQTEILHVGELFDITNFIQSGLEGKSDEDLIKVEDELIFVAFNLPEYEPISKQEINNRFSFIVSDNFIITIHDRPVPSLNIFSKEMELDIIQQNKINNNQLLYIYLFKCLFVNSEQQLAKKDQLLARLNQQIIQKNLKNKFLIKLNTGLLIIIILISLYVLINL